MIFLLQWRVGVGQSKEGKLWWWCKFSVSVSAQEKRQRDKALPEDESKVASLSWLNGKEA
jgi:hypothetical protein